MKKYKTKKWLVCLSCVEYDEFEVMAATMKEARKKAQREVDKNYGDMRIDTITKI